MAFHVFKKGESDWHTPLNSNFEGSLEKTVYDPTKVEGDVFRASNHKLTGYQKAGVASDITPRDNTTQAFGKVSAALGDLATVSGNNTNGSYTKFPDGTLLCWKKVVTQNYAITSSTGQMYYGPTVNIGDYAQPFVGDFAVSVIGLSSNITTVLPGVSDNGNSFNGYRSTALTVPTLTVTGIAIGRWKE